MIPLLVIFVLLLVLLYRRLRNAVQISLTGLCDATTALLLILLQHTDLLERLHDLAVNGAGSVDVMVRPRAPVLGGAVDFPQAADADVLAEVDVAGYGCGADIEPGGKRRR
jgi:hypothetical protein